MVESIWHHERMTFAQSDFTSMGLPTGSIGRIVYFETLEYALDGRLLISMLNEVLNSHVPDNRFNFRDYTL